jgi:uncharacterized membrane protein
MSVVLWLQNVWERLRTTFWFVPSLMAAGAILLAYLMGHVEESFGHKYIASIAWIYSGGADGARGVLSAIASSVIGVAGTTFSITIAVLSLTSGQFGPRLLRTFMRDVGNQLVLGTFTSTFLYCLLVLRTIRETDGDKYVPHLSVTVGVALAVLSVGVLIYFVNHIAASIQVSHLIQMVGEETDERVAQLFSERAPVPAPPSTIPDEPPFEVFAAAAGYVETIDEEGLFATATKHDLLIRLEIRPGNYALPRARVLSAWPAARAKALLSPGFMSCARDRTTQQDLEFSFLQLAEVAVRALSPGINDPFTAMMCIDRITASMCNLSLCSWPSEVRADESGRVRLIARRLQPAELVEAAFGHIRHAALHAPSVTRKLQQSIGLLIEQVRDPRLLGELRRMFSELGSSNREG